MPRKMVRTQYRLSGANPDTTNPNAPKSVSFSGGLEIQIEGNLPYLVLSNNDTVAHTLTFNHKNSVYPAVVFQLPIGGVQSYPILPFTTVQLDSSGTGSNVTGVYSDLPVTGPRLAGGTGHSFLCGSLNALTVSTTASYYATGQSANYAASSGSSTFVPLPAAGTLLNFYVYVNSNASGGAALTFTVNLQSTPGVVSSSALTVSFGAGTHGIQSDTSHTEAVTAGYGFNIEAILGAGGSSGAVTAFWCVEFVG